MPGEYACISPVYGSSERTRRKNSVNVPPFVNIIQDSGAFSDGPTQRLSFEAALERQEKHAFQYRYRDQITHRASYDLLIDEKWSGGVRSNQRWTEVEAERAVDETVAAAQYIVANRRGLGLILSAQGVNVEQYVRCTQRILPLMNVETDMLGLGGFCITGRFYKQMLPIFKATVEATVAAACEHGVQRIHVWGVLYAPALAWLLWMCDRCEIALSTDSSGPSRRPGFGAWGYAEWRDNNYVKPPKGSMGFERARHVQATRDWLDGFRQTKHYLEVSGS